MVFFEFSADTPASTTKLSPVETIMRLNAGIIHFVEFDFPAGCEGLVHATVNQGGVRIWPRNESDDIAGQFFPIRFNEFYELAPGEAKLVMRTWNDDTENSHTVRIRIGVLQKDELFPEIKLGDLIRMFFRLFRRR